MKNIDKTGANGYAPVLSRLDGGPDLMLNYAANGNDMDFRRAKDAAGRRNICALKQ